MLLRVGLRCVPVIRSHRRPTRDGLCAACRCRHLRGQCAFDAVESLTIDGGCDIAMYVSPTFVRVHDTRTRW